MDGANQVQILDKAGCILHSTNTLCKGIQQAISISTISKELGRQGSLNFEKKNSEFKPVKLRLKLILCHILPMVERLGKCICNLLYL